MFYLFSYDLRLQCEPLTDTNLFKVKFYDFQNKNNYA